MTFAEATTVTGGPGEWKGNLDEGWDILGVTNGGYIMAVAARAMGAELEGRHLMSVTGSFLNPAGAGPIVIDVEILKQGRSLSMARAKVSKEGREIVDVIGVYADPERPVNNTDLVLGSPPDLPAPDDCHRMEPAKDAPFPPPITGKLDLRLHPEDVAWATGESSGRPLVRGWFRLRDEEPLDAEAVVFSTDAFPPAIFNTDIGAAWTPTVDLSIQIRDPAPTGWLAGRLSSRFITGGMLEEDGEIWDERGNLVALSRQLALVPR